MKALTLIFTLLITGQAFGSSLDDALQAALTTADQDHQAKQVKLKVAPDQIAKAKFTRVKANKVIDLDQMNADESSDEEEVFEVEQEVAVQKVKQLGDI
jgi:hypothetical protein